MWVSRIEKKPKLVKILTDPQANIKALDSVDFKSTIALRTAEALENLKWKVKGCKIAWVKAHIGTEGKEMADEVARTGAENKTSNLILVNTPMPGVVTKENVDMA